MHAIQKGRKLTRSLIAASIAAGLCGSAFGQEDKDKPKDVTVSGYLQVTAGWNANKIIETNSKSGQLSELRGQAYLEAVSMNPTLQWKLSGRVAREYKTSYLERLENLERYGGSASPNPNFNVMDVYNKGEMREAWLQVQPFENLNVKFGLQQVVWGETDLFQALDVIHGQNASWGMMLTEPDETRKPLILLNSTLSVPAADGSVQLVLRPGWDAYRNIGLSADVYGGRSRPIGFKGWSSDFYNDYGDLNNKLTYALRWKGIAGGANYHLSYVHMPYVRNLIANSVFAPYEKPPIGSGIANWIYPVVNTYGAGVNTYVQPADTVVTGEVVFTKNEPFNVGSVPGGPSSAAACLGPFNVPFATSFSGACGVKRKNTVMTMLRAEKSIKTMDTLGTSSPMSANLQIFHTRIQGFNRADEIVQGVGYPNLVDKASTFASLILRAPFMADKFAPLFVVGRDFTNQGTLYILAADYELGTNWRFHAELDKFIGNSTVQMQTIPGVGYLPVGGASGIPGWLGDNSRFYLRATYQF